MNFKKKVNGSWHNTPHYVHKTDTDTITTLPADIYPNAVTATVGLKGNMSVSGTPTPDNPVMPQGTGERTGNLWGVPIVQGAVADSGDLVSLNTRVRGEYIPVQSETQYTISCNKAIRTIYAYQNKGKIKAIYGSSSQTTTITFTTPANCDSICVGFMNDPNTAIITPSDIEFVMLNTGSTPLPYEPFGVKIPISSASTTTPVYLGEVESTRWIKKYEFTGTESISSNTLGASRVGFTIAISDMLSNGRKNGYCTHFVAQNSPSGSSLDGITYGASDKVLYVTFSVATATAYNLTDVASVKTWLAQQYAAGTPVTVWYVLSEPETGIVNEPIRKIGDYADTVSGITIPTITGADSFDVLTTLKPSEVSLTYTGWHDAQCKEWDGSQWR